MDEKTTADSVGGQLSRRSFLGASAALSALGLAGGIAAPATAATVPVGEIQWPRVSRPSDLSRIVLWDAAELSVAIRKRVVSCREVMTAYLDHIDRINPQVNAIVLLRPRADLLAEAAEKDARLAAGRYDGWMHGFPWAVKDLSDVKGIKTTSGFWPLDWIGPATADSLFVSRIRAAGAIFIGKTNTPEWGLGSQTYNNVFGTTLNAWDQTRTCGGSSGGAAVAVALRMVPAADGSDFMGSLRNPPGWNNVLGLRPSVGRVPWGAGGEAFVDQSSTAGPIARTALDLALLLRTMAGYDAQAPLSLDSSPADVTKLEPTSMKGKKVAWLGDLGGYLPMEPEVLTTTQRALGQLSNLGMSVTTLDGLPTYGTFKGNQDLWPTWLVYRHWLIGAPGKELYDNGLKDMLKPEGVYEVDGLLVGADGNGPLSGLDVYQASLKRTDMYHAFRVLFQTYDYVMLPTAQVMPFSADVHWPDSIEGVPMSSYHRWMEVTTIGTLLNAPTLAVPAGFGSSGLPIGLQVIGRNHGDADLLDFAAAWERQTKFVQRALPPLIA